jgi:predicted ATP-dependent endonuclease of OLD family
MVIIQDVHVARFRSIREGKLANLKDFSALAGLNNSGKSNFLRALNLFFTNRPEPGTPFDLTRDFYRGERSAKKKKRITIAVHFSLPTTFRFRKGLEAAESLLGSDFTIHKSWTADQLEPEVRLNDSELSLGLDDAAKVNQFLGLISFRYIPNRVIPTDVIRQEQQALRDVLVRRLAKYRKESKAVFEGLQSTAEALVQTLSDDINKFAPDIAKVSLATASSLADLAFNFGYRLTEGNAQMEETGGVVDSNFCT